MTRSDFDEDAEPLIKELGWKTVRKLVRYDTAIMMYRSMHKIAPTYLSDIFQPLKDVHQIELRDTSSNLRLARVTTNMGLRSFSYQGAAVWNKLEAKKKMDTLLSHKLNLRPFLTLLFILIYIRGIIVSGFTRLSMKNSETDAQPCLNKLKNFNFNFNCNCKTLG